jgi:hypothetical protein
VGTALVVVCVALALTLAVIGVLRLRGDGKKTFKLEDGVPTQVSPAQLKELFPAGHPVYWVGRPTSGRLELTKTSRNQVYVRYLKPGAAIGDRAPSYTTIATYPFPGAYASMQRSAQTQGYGHAKLADGGLAVWRRSPGTSVYIAHLANDYLVEVYDPSPRRARSLALSGKVRRVR